MAMDKSYIAGFFDGEGSAMALTIKRILPTGTIYRIRPVIKIAQGTREVLEEIKNFLGFGTIVGRKGRVYNLQINGNKSIIKFVDMISPYAFLKKKQLKLLKKISLFQTTKTQRNIPYTKKEMHKMLTMRDEVFKSNLWTKTRIKQKYPINKVMKENTFVDIKKWKKQRSQKGIQAMIKYQKGRKSGE